MSFQIRVRRQAVSSLLHGNHFCRYRFLSYCRHLMSFQIRVRRHLMSFQIRVRRQAVSSLLHGNHFCRYRFLSYCRHLMSFQIRVRRQAVSSLLQILRRLPFRPRCYIYSLPNPAMEVLILATGLLVLYRYYLRPIGFPLLYPFASE